MRIAQIIAITFALLFAAPASAWNLYGHMMVAAVAWDQLAPATKRRAAVLLRLNQDHADWIAMAGKENKDNVAFVRASYWPDDIKNEKKYGYSNDNFNAHEPDSTRNTGYSDKMMHKYWHYINLPFSTDGTKLLYPPAPNVETQINILRDVLASRTASEDLKSYNLVWLLHLVGDVHQPLHAATRFSTDLPTGDRGGNDTKLMSAPGNLHKLWDDIMGDRESPLAAIAAARKIPRATGSAVVNRHVGAWIEESFQIAKESVYQPPIGAGGGPHPVTDQYKQKAAEIARARIALAGARLARLLNENLR